MSATPPAAASANLQRILMLHGYAQSAKIFSSKLSSVRKACRNVAEFEFVDAPHLIDLPPEWTTPESVAEAEADPALKPRGWWTVQKHDDGTETATGLELSLDYLAEYIKAKGPFDAVWGFSQGGALAVILSSILESSQNHPAFTDLQPFDYTISIAGLKSRDPKNAVYYTHLLQGRNLQVIGRADAIVSDERSAELITCAAQPRVEYHQGGHHTPSQARWRAFFKDYIEARGDADKVASPEPESAKN